MPLAAEIPGTVGKGLLTVVQFAEALGVKPATVRQWVWRRKVEFVRVRRSIRFRPETAQRIISEGTVPELGQPQ